jgi:hypothetical protein
MTHSSEDNVDNVAVMDNVEGENVAVMEEEVSPARPEKRKRGPTMCKKITEQNEILPIEFRKNGCAKGENRAKYSNFCAVTVKKNASILVERWDKFDDKKDKDQWWNIVKVKCLTILFFFFNR